MHPTFKIVPATFLDVPTIAQFSADNFDNDTNTQVKALCKLENDFRDGTIDHLNSLVDHPRVELLKAVNDENGEIMGFVAWVYRNFEGRDGSMPKKDESRTSEQEEEPKEKVKTKADELEEVTDADMQYWMEKLMPEGMKCMFVVSISVREKYQGSGLGQALLRWGTEQTDKEGVFAWAHSSEAGFGAFRKAGFVEVGQLTVDLDKYAIAPNHLKGNVNEKWGEYTFRYMRRPGFDV